MSAEQVAGRRDNALGPIAIVNLVRRLRARRETDRSPALINSAVLLTLGSAAIHFAVAPQHIGEYLPYGIFFLCLGTAQVALALAIALMPSRRLFAMAAAGTLGVIGIWLLSRTIGVPIAPVPWRPEPVGFPDLVATLLEGISVIQFLRLFRRPRRPRRRGRIRVALKMIPMVLFAPLVTYLGVGASLTPMPVAYNAAPAAPGQASTSVADLTAPPGPEPVKTFTLTASVSSIGGHEAWTFNRAVPGPELRVTQGDRVRVTLVNHLPAATSIHWHGIRIPNAEDGVAGITQDAVPTGGSFVYEFMANDAGTFWYHSHQDTSNQIPRGLIGALVVEPSGKTAERDYTLMIHILPGSDSVAVNGSARLRLDANPGETVRLRLVNAIPAIGFGPTGQLQMPALLGAPYAIAALDGHDLNRPQELGPEQIPLGMGQRADLVFKMPAGGTVRVAGIKGPEPFLPFSPRQSTANVTVGEGADLAAVDTTSLPRFDLTRYCLLYTSPSPRDLSTSRMPSSA